MTRRLEAGPLLVALGALLLLVSLFLTWFTGDLSAWQVFEVWDIVLLVLALGLIAAGVGLSTQDVALVDRRFLPVAVGAVAVIVASQIIDPPPAATGQDPDTGAWLALGGALVMCLGAVLTFGRIHLAFTVEGRDSRRRVAAVDARGADQQATETETAGASEERGAGARLFSREETADRDGAPTGTETKAPERRTPRRAGKATPEPKQQD